MVADGRVRSVKWIWILLANVLQIILHRVLLEELVLGDRLYLPSAIADSIGKSTNNFTYLLINTLFSCLATVSDRQRWWLGNYYC